jgi:hypothetical protein
MPCSSVYNPAESQERHDTSDDVMKNSETGRESSPKPARHACTQQQQTHHHHEESHRLTSSRENLTLLLVTLGSH